MVKDVKRPLPVRLFLVTALVTVILALAACADVQVTTSECEDGGELWTEYRLFMGRNVDGVEVVSDADWGAFLEDTVTPRFPDGLSVFDVAGQGSNADGTIERERAKMLLVLVPPTDETAVNRLNEASTEYKQRFNQNSVLRVIAPVCVAFK